MNLIIDVGNTSVKLAVFDKHKLIERKTVSVSNLFESVKTLSRKYDYINKSIISSVGKIHQKDLEKVEHLIGPLMVLNHMLKMPFKNKYKTPKTLGVDRLALVSASADKYPNRNVLIIDAGTCVTYDFINSNNEYLGGAISPGLRLRYQILNNATANLPLLDTKEPKDIIGQSTEEAIHSGVVNGLIMEIDGVIMEYKEVYKDLTVIFTGGDANFLSKQLKSGIFANPNFLLEGLNAILYYNLSK